MNCDNCESLRLAALDRIKELEDKLLDREWVGLTYEEFDEINQSGEVVEDIINWVSAKLKEKNA